MASILEREFSFCDRAQNNLTLSALCDQKQSAIFCDVIMKVCGREIFAHSNILAAASPYFNSFLRQDLPRQFSQRTPQVIEIQIDGSEPSVYFEEAVAAVVDFIYTGKMLINECNVSQICEIGRIMQMDNIVKFCSDFMEGRTDLNDTIQGRTEMQSFGGENKTLVECSTMTDSWAADSASMYQKHKVTPKVGDPEFHAKIKARQLVSVSCQIYPHLLPELAKDDARMQDQATSTDNRYFEMLHKLNKGATRGRKRKAKDIDQSEPEVHRYKLIHTESGDVILSAETGELIVPEQQMADQEQVTMLITEGIDESEVFPSAEQSQNLRVYAEDIMVLRDMEYDPTAKKEGNCEPCSTVTVIEHVDVGHNVEPDGTGAKISTTAADGDFPEDQFNSSENVDEDDDDDFTVSLTKLSPRRSRRVTKPSARLQEFQELQEIHVSQFKKIKQEIIEILPISDARVVEIVPIEQLERVGTTSKAYLEGVVEKSLVEHHSPLKQERVEQEEAAVRLLSLANEFVQKDQIQDDLEDDLDDDLDDDLEEHSDDMKHIQKSVPRLVWQAKSVRDELQRKSARKVMSNVSVVQIGPGKYQCDTCTFSTNRVRQMSAHIKLHKLENNTCYYCEKTFSTKEELGGHMSEHKGPVPFFCHVCSMRFKSRTLLNMHLPKHSDNKPFICHVCSMGFKWKHALKCHMITHSNKKEHLCDTCGYATAHKSQLKAHRKIHSGDMLKCHYPECQFLATKTQNMKYHLLTHTKVSITMVTMPHTKVSVTMVTMSHTKVSVTMVTMSHTKVSVTMVTMSHTTLVSITMITMSHTKVSVTMVTMSHTKVSVTMVTMSHTKVSVTMITMSYTKVSITMVTMSHTKVSVTMVTMSHTKVSITRARTIT